MIATGFTLFAVGLLVMWLSDHLNIPARLLGWTSLGAMIGLGLMVLGIIKWMWRVLP